MVYFLSLNAFSFLLQFFVCLSQTVLDVDELSVQYGIEITNKPVILNSQPADENVLHLSSKHGQLYSCFLPQVPQEQDQEPSGGTPVENVIDILDKSLNGTCMTHKKGWWTYKLCHKKSITQYHVGEGGDVDSPVTNLGSFSSEDDWTKEEVLERKPSEIYHSHQFVNGTVCDVTQEPRKTTVQYFCSTKPGDSIIRIEEPATCEYIITVHSAKLCTHPLFSKKETKKSINLVCSPALMEHEYNKYMEKMNKKKEAEEEKLKDVLKKKMELDEAVKKKASLDGSSTDELGIKGEMGDMKKDGKKVKNTMADIASFMKGFMNVLNIKSDATKVIKDSVTDADSKFSLADLDKDMKELFKDTTGSELELTGKGSLKTLNDITESMIKQLEEDSERMQKKSAKEREVMQKEFDRVRQQAMKELAKSQNMLHILESLKKEGRSIQSRKELEKQIRQVRTLVESIQGQIKTIDDKKKTVDELEKDTNKRLEDINKKIHSTKAAHKFAKSLEGVNNEKNPDDDFKKLITGIFSDGEEQFGNEGEKVEKSASLDTSDDDIDSDKKGEKMKDDGEVEFEDVFTLDGHKLLEKQDGNTKKMDEILKNLKEEVSKMSDVDNKKLDMDDAKAESNLKVTVEKNTDASNEEDNEDNDDDDDDDDSPFKEVFRQDSDKLTMKKNIGSAKKMREMAKDLKVGKVGGDMKKDKMFSVGDANSENKDKITFESDTDSSSKNAGESAMFGDLEALREKKNAQDRSKLVKDMLKNLRDEVRKLKTDIKNNKFVKGDKGSAVTKEELTSDSETDDVTEENKKNKKTGFESLANMLKKEMSKLNDKIKEEKDSVSPSARSKDDIEKGVIEETEKDAKKKMEVRIRSIDEKSYNKEFGKTLDENVREEVKEATKKMEDTVRKQLKEAGLDFGDNIKIKIITTKDKFDQFSNGKDVKLLSDDDAADFKDLLLGFLGGGKEKVNEEQRQRTLEANYNFKLDDEEEDAL